MHSDGTTPEAPEPIDPWADLDKQLDAEPADDWDPEPGERLRGTLVAIDYRPTSKGHTLAILRIAQRDGTEARVLCGRKLLRERLIELKPQPGDLVALQFDGLVDAKGGGQPYYSYRVGLVPMGDRDPSKAFQDPAKVKVERDLGLTDEAQQATDPWTNGDNTQPGF